MYACALNARRSNEKPANWSSILDPQVRTFAETPGMDRLLPPGIFPSGQNLALAVRSPKAYRTGAKLFSLVTLNEESGSQAYTFQVAQDRSSDERVERDFAVLFVILLLGSVLSAASIAIIVTKRGLRPLEPMTRSLGRVDPTHLKERVGPSRWPSELQPRAIGVADILKRLD